MFSLWIINSIFILGKELKEVVKTPKYNDETKISITFFLQDIFFTCEKTLCKTIL